MLKAEIEKKKKESYREAGFTVIEMLVVVGVSAVLSSIFFSYGTLFRNQLAVFSEEAVLTQTITQAKSLSVQALSEGALGVACGYGVHIDRINNRYFIFRKEKDGTGQCPSNERDYGWTRSSEIRGGIHEIDERVFVSRSSNVTDIVFRPPGPTVVMLPTPQSRRLRSVVLCAQVDTGFCREVTVNQVGQVSSGNDD